MELKKKEENLVYYKMDEIFNNTVHLLKIRFQAEIEETFNKIKHSSTLEEIAHLRGLMDGINYCLQTMEYMNKGNV